MKLKKYLKKLNLFDIIGISFFFFIIGLSVVFFLRKSSYVYVTIRVSKEESYTERWGNRPPHWYIENLSTGLMAKDVMGKINLEVTDVYYYPINTSEQTVFVTLKVRTTYNKKTRQHSYQGQPLLVGYHQIFKIESIAIPGLIHRINESNKPLETVEVIVKGKLENEKNEKNTHDANVSFSGVKNVLADSLYKGLIINDSKGSLIASIEDIIIKPATKEFIYGKNLVKIIDPDRKDVYLSMRVRLQIVNVSSLYREENIILLNEPLRFDFKNFTVEMTVTDIIE